MTSSSFRRPSKPGFETAATGCTALVTGSSGLCGARLVELLLERGAKTVIAFDLAPPSKVLQDRFNRIQEQTGGKIIVFSGMQDGNLCSEQAVQKAFDCVPHIDVVFHIAALVGPFHEYNQYMAVNRDGTIRILEHCRRCKVPKMVYSSSPSTRFTGKDVTGQREEELPFPNKWLAMYAETKAYGEMKVSAANNGKTFFTISVAPHQVYGPHDGLFLPNLLETCGTGRLRIFGNGRSIISTCYVDNYCHGLLCGADALYPDSPALGKFYIVTDGKPQKFWQMLNQASVQMGFVDLYSKFHLPVWLLYGVAYVCNVLGFIMNKKFKLNPFNIRMLTMHRYFSLENSQRDLQYQPLMEFEDAWQLTIDWFRTNWLPQFLAKNPNAKGMDKTKQRVGGSNGNSNSSKQD